MFLVLSIQDANIFFKMKFFWKNNKVDFYLNFICLVFLQEQTNCYLLLILVFTLEMKIKTSCLNFLLYSGVILTLIDNYTWVISLIVHVFLAWKPSFAWKLLFIKMNPLNLDFLDKAKKILPSFKIKIWGKLVRGYQLKSDRFD